MCNYNKEDKNIFSFNDLQVKDSIKQALTEMEFTAPTPIQAEVIPHILAGSDCLAEAPTGTGKTFAFGIPAIESIDTENKDVQVVIMCPTRELAMQTEKELKRLAEFTPNIRMLAVYGGQPITRQLAALRRKPQIVVGTPGRVLDHIRRKTLNLKGVKMIVLDEADEMLNMGFREDIDLVLSAMPDELSVHLFSATMPKEILEISKNYQTDPVRVKTACATSEKPNIKQYFVRTKEKAKFEILNRIMRDQDYHLALVFCNTKRKVDDITDRLNDCGCLAAGLHGDLRQRQRDAVMKSYRNGELNILVATDVAARGIDVDGIEAVFNYDLPIDEEYYVHRIGRTARASKAGVSYSFISSADKGRIARLEKLTGSKMEELIVNLADGSPIETSSKPLFNTTRFFINVGIKDNADEQSLSAFIIESSPLIHAEDIDEVQMLNLFSFVEIRSELTKEMLSIGGTKFAGRVVAIELAAEKEPIKRGNRKKDNHGGYQGHEKPRDFVRFGDRERKVFSDKPFAYGDKPKRSYGDKPAFGDKPKRSYGDRPDFGDKPKRSYGDKPAYGDKPKRSYGDKPAFGDKPKRSYGDKPAFGDKPKRSYGDKPAFGDKPKRSYGDKPAFGDKPKRSYDRKSDSSFDKPARDSYKSNRTPMNRDYGDTKRGYSKKPSHK